MEFTVDRTVCRTLWHKPSLGYRREMGSNAASTAGQTSCSTSRRVSLCVLQQLPR
jgi:hypothetical protein